MHKIAVIGMVGNSAFLSVPAFHKAGETVAATAIHFEPGGKGFNQAVAAARFGAEVSFLGAVGAECYDEIVAFLKKDGITPVLPRKDEPTAYAAILTDAKGANRVTVYQGARLAEADVERFAACIAQADILLLNNEVPQTVNSRAIDIAKKHGTKVILNPAPSVSLSADILERVDLFTPNEHELSGLEEHDNVVVTLGDKGCLVKETGETVPAVKQKKVIDTTGAGDTFNGVLAAGLASGMPMKDAVLTAVAAAGVSVTRPYAATAIPYAAEVADYLAGM